MLKGLSPLVVDVQWAKSVKEVNRCYDSKKKG